MRMLSFTNFQIAPATALYAGALCSLLLQPPKAVAKTVLIKHPRL